MGIRVYIGANTGEFDRAIKRVKGDLKNAFGSDALKASEKLLSKMKYIAVGFAALGAASVKMAADVEQTRTALVTLLKSTEQADSLLKEIKYFAATTPFEFQGLAKASQQMIAFGFSSEAVVPVLRTVGDAVSGLGGNQETMDTIVRVLGQVQTMGKVTSKEIMQLSRQGVNAYQYLADAAGKTTAEIQQDLKNGAISSSEAIKAIMIGMNNQFAGGMENQSKTLLGLWATTRENVTGIMRQVGASITKEFSLKERFGEFSSWLTKFTVEVENSGFKKAFAEMVPNGFKENLVVIGGVITGLLVPAFAMLAINVLAATWPILAIGAACGAAAGLIYRHWETVGPFFKGLWDGIITVFRNAYEYITGIVNRIVAAYNWMKSKLGFEVENKAFDVEVAVKTTEAEKDAESFADKMNRLIKDTGGKYDKNAEKNRKKQESEWNKLVKAAEQTSSRIEDEWIRLTRTQLDALEKWYREEIKTLNETKKANVNFERDLTRLEEVYAEKRRKIFQDEARERLATFKNISDGYISMQRKIVAGSLSGSKLELFNMSLDLEDELKSVTEFFDNIAAEYASGTEQQKRNILESLNAMGIQYKRTVSDTLDFEAAQLAAHTEIKKAHYDREVEYYAQCKDIQADIDKAYNQASLNQLKAALTKENAARLNALESQQTMMKTYQEAYLASVKTTTDLAADMYQGIFSGMSSAISDVLMGVSSISEAFEALGRSILQILADWVAQKIAGMLTVDLLEKNLLGGSLASEIAKEQALATAKSAMIATTTAEQIAAIGSVAAAQVAAEQSLLAAGLVALEAFSLASIAQGAAVAAAWAAAAANVSLASFGANAGPAMAGISATHALTTSLSVPKLAEGGLATGPTIAMIGEGRYKEAVVPLSDKVFDRLAEGINRAGGGNNATINVYGDINSASDEDRIFKGLYKDVKIALMGA